MTYPIHSSAGGRLAGLHTKGELRRCMSCAAVYCSVTMESPSILQLPKDFVMGSRGVEGVEGAVGSQSSDECNETYSRSRPYL